MSKEELKKRILDEARKRGFLFEIDVQNLFDKRGWFTRPNARFITEDGEVEIDLLTHKTISNKDGFNALDVVCSCKKSETKPWVFYLTKRNVLDNPHSTIKFTATSETVGKSSYVTGAKRYWLNQDIKIDDLNVNNFKLRGKTYYLAFSDPKNKKSRQIYEAINEIIKFLKYELARRRESNKQITSQRITTLYCPLIVLDGDLIGITNEERKVTVEEKNYIPLIIESGDTLLGSLLIHVVKKDFLEKFITNLEEDLESFNKKIIQYLEKKEKQKAKQEKEELMRSLNKLGEV